MPNDLGRPWCRLDCAWCLLPRAQTLCLLRQGKLKWQKWLGVSLSFEMTCSWFINFIEKTYCSWKATRHRRWSGPTKWHHGSQIYQFFNWQHLGTQHGGSIQRDEETGATWKKAWWIRERLHAEKLSPQHPRGAEIGSLRARPRRKMPMRSTSLLLSIF